MEEDFIIKDFPLLLTPSQKQKVDFLFSFFIPYTKNIYIVGGILRDQILGIPSDDIDIELYDIDTKTYYILMEKLGAKELSKDFFVYNYEGIDISLPRIEIKMGEGYHGFRMETTNSPLEAIKRRDFTCNALMFHLHTKQLHDYCSGAKDIQNKILRAVSKEQFQDDGVRFLRGIRMMTRYHFKPEPQTNKLLLEMSLQNITKTKIEKELKKILGSNPLEAEE